MLVGFSWGSRTSSGQEALRRPLGGPPSGENPLVLKETPVFQEVPALVGETSSRTLSS